MSTQTDPDEQETDAANRTILNEKLYQLSIVLKKSFKAEFIDSLSYLIRLENQSQARFNQSLEEKHLDWYKLEYFMLQLKKIIKHKSQLLELVNNMQIHGGGGGISSRSTQTAAHNSKNLLNEYYSTAGNTSNSAYFSNLVIEYSNFSEKSTNRIIHDANNDFFLLTCILIRLLFKLINYSNFRDNTANVPIDQNKLASLRLLLLSCLADLSFYEEIRTQVRLKIKGITNLYN